MHYKQIVQLLNTAVGISALQENTTGNGNVAVGKCNAKTQLKYCIAIGYDALQQNNANNNTAVGHDALKLNTTGDTRNAAVGG